MDHDRHSNTGQVAFANVEPIRRPTARDESERQRLVFPAKRLLLPEPKNIPPRPWLLGRRLMCGQVTAVISPPSGGKSMDSTLIAVSIATNTPLTHERIYRPGRVWQINNEEPEEEMLRRLSAVSLKYGIDRKLMEENILINSGINSSLVIARKDARGCVAFNDEVVNSIIRQINEHEIVCLIVDPFISTHEVEENDNSMIDKVVTKFLHIANVTGCAILLPHHTRKMSGASNDGHAGNPESARGASSLIGKARVVYTLSEFSKTDAPQYGIREEDRLKYVRVDRARLTYVAKGDKPMMVYRWCGVSLGNPSDTYEADSVGVLEAIPMNELEAMATGAADINSLKLQNAIVSALNNGDQMSVTQLVKTIMDRRLHPMGRNNLRDAISKTIPLGEQNSIVYRNGTISCLLYAVESSKQNNSRLIVRKDFDDTQSEEGN